jgi:predicted acylesterase/phospholipase RssA
LCYLVCNQYVIFSLKSSHDNSLNIDFRALVASAAVPGILPGVVLMQKTKNGDLRPMNFGSKFKDGSLRVDIPLESLHLLFNVNYAIVSQGR